MNYTDVFGETTVPPSQYNYSAYSLEENTVSHWSDNYSGTGVILSSIVELTSDAAYSFNLPPANEVSNGRDVLIQNKGLYDLSICYASGDQFTTISAGQALWLYVTDNTTSDGTWEQVLFGVGSSTLDASTLAGYGLKAIDATLNQSHTVVPINESTIIDETHRSKLLVYTSGIGAFLLPSVLTVSEGFFFLLRNSGSGSLTINPHNEELIDSVSTITVNPSESMIIFCSGSAWYTVGWGRTADFAYTQLIKDVSAAGTITLTTLEAKNNLLTFTGSPASNPTIVVPDVVSIYYVYNNLSTAKSILMKTSAGATVTIPQSERVIVFCDGTDIISAQSASVTTTIALVAGTSATPSMNFADSTNSGMFLSGSTNVGIAVSGNEVATFTASGLNLPTPLSIANGGTGASTEAGILTIIGGQPLDADLTAVAGLTTVGITRRTANGVWSAGTPVGLTTEVTGVLPIANGGTGSSVDIRNNITLSGTISLLGSQRSYSIDSPFGTLSCSDGNYFKLSVSSAITVSFTNLPSASQVYSMTLEVLLQNVVNAAITWPGNIKWSNSVVPTLTKGKYHLITFLTSNGGVTWYGSSVTNFSV